jgi:hypothetical protein
MSNVRQARLNLWRGRIARFALRQGAIGQARWLLPRDVVGLLSAI